MTRMAKNSIWRFITYARKKLEMIQIAESEEINENEELICVDNVEKLEREELERVCLSLGDCLRFTDKMISTDKSNY